MVACTHEHIQKYTRIIYIYIYIYIYDTAIIVDKFNDAIWKFEKVFYSECMMLKINSLLIQHTHIPGGRISKFLCNMLKKIRPNSSILLCGAQNLSAKS